MADLVTEIESGDRLRALIALRGELARAIAAGPEPKDLAALTLRLERVLDTIDAMGVPTEETDELAAKRQAKLSATSGP